MKYKQWFWQGTIAALLSVAITNSVTAQVDSTNSDNTGMGVYQAPASGADYGTSGNAAAIFGIRNRRLNSATGEISFNFQGLNGEFSIDPSVLVNSEFGSGSGSDSLTYDSAQCTGRSCQDAALAENQEITLNEIAELLELDLESSLDRLAMAEEAVREEASEPRRIVRRTSQRECVNPYIRAQDEVDRKLEQSQQFIEQVEPIKPENSMW